MMALTIILMVVLLLNSILCFGILGLIFYNLLEFTLDKRYMRKDLPPFFRKYAKLWGS